MTELKRPIERAGPPLTVTIDANEARLLLFLIEDKTSKLTGDEIDALMELETKLRGLRLAWLRRQPSRRQ